MCKKGLFLCVAVLLSHIAYGQYEDDAPLKQADSATPAKNSIFQSPSMDNAVPGLELMISFGNGYFFGDLSPFVGYKPVKQLLVAVGANGSVFNVQGASSSSTYLNYGGHVFARLNIGQVAFLHAEMRAVNGVPLDNINSKVRTWSTSPIFGIGFAQGSNMSSWALIGYATNTEFSNLQPLGSLVYRIGFTF
jgi:hypothetical protein